MLNKLWSKLDGKKSILGMALLFIWGGLSALGYSYPELKEIALWITGAGALHKLDKLKK